MADGSSFKPVLSIIIPIYNVEKYIGECLKSIAAQTFRDYEVLMIDDGSTDGSSGICKFYTMDERFIYIYKQNGGVSSARNAGIDMARGKYLAFVDPDDILASDMYEIMIAKLETENADFVQCLTRVITDSGKYDIAENGAIEFIEKINMLYDVKEVSENNTEVLERICENGYNCLSWGKVFRRELWADSKYPIELSLGEDMATIIPVLSRANRAVKVRDTIYYYRIRKKSLLHGTVTKERFLEDMEGSRRMYDALIERKPEIAEAAMELKEFYDTGCLTNYLSSEREKKNCSILYALMQVSDYIKGTKGDPYLASLCGFLSKINNK